MRSWSSPRCQRTCFCELQNPWKRNAILQQDQLSLIRLTLAEWRPPRTVVESEMKNRALAILQQRSAMCRADVWLCSFGGGILSGGSRYHD
jgi:hypothetical protein